VQDFLSRRRFMTSGIALSAAASLATVPSVSRSMSSDPLGLKLPIHLALFDTRFSAAHAFARALAIRGVTLAPFDGDVTPVWFEQLDPVWRQYPLTVAGLTTEGALFCLEQLAWDNGMRVAYRGIHATSPEGGTDHLLETSVHRSHDVQGGISGAQPWPAQVADIIANIDEALSAFPSDAQDRSRATYRTRSRTDHAPSRLVSWLIAPKNWRVPEPIAG
jgi:hypothetical protein